MTSRNRNDAPVTSRNHNDAELLSYKTTNLVRGPMPFSKLQMVYFYWMRKPKILSDSNLVGGLCC